MREVAKVGPKVFLGLYIAEILYLEDEVLDLSGSDMIDLEFLMGIREWKSDQG